MRTVLFVSMGCGKRGIGDSINDFPLGLHSVLSSWCRIARLSSTQFKQKGRNSLGAGCILTDFTLPPSTFIKLPSSNSGNERARERQMQLLVAQTEEARTDRVEYLERRSKELQELSRYYRRVSQTIQERARY